MEAKKKEIKKPTLFTAVLPLIFMFVVLFQNPSDHLCSLYNLCVHVSGTHMERY